MNILNKLTTSYLKLNRKRTLVTIIGIILTGAMISGVTTIATSFQSFMTNIEKELSGDWEAKFSDVRFADVKYFENNNEYKDVFLEKNLEAAQNPYNKENFINVREYDNKALEKYTINLINGRLPQSSKEIVLSENIENVKVGDKIKLTIGKRMENGEEKVYYREYTEGETFNPIETKEYEIVGIIEEPRFENTFSLGAITLLEKAEFSNEDTLTVNINCKDASKIYETTEATAKSLNLSCDDIDYNSGLLMYMGVSNSDGFMPMLYGVCAVLIGVIAVGAVVVIYNSFAISVSERKKQFGMLASIGATKKQIKKMVVYEGVILAAISIPLGILSGIFGIGVTLNVVNGLIKPMFVETVNTNLELTVSYISIIIAAVLIAITVYISVLIPAKKASKISPIEAIRGTGDIKAKAKKLRTPKFLRKIYGIEGDLALKNLKRSRKRYRTTVISLVISIVLFLTFNGFVTYMFEGFDALYTTVNYDYQVQLYGENEEATNKIKQIEAEKIVAEKYISAMQTSIPEANLDDSLKNNIEKNETTKSRYAIIDGKCNVDTYVVSLDEEEYKSYLQKIGLNSLKDDECILMDYVDGLYMYRSEFYITNYKENDTIKLIRQHDNKELNMKIAKVTSQTPYGIPNNYGMLVLVINENKLNEISKDFELKTSTQIMIEAENSKDLKEKVDKIMKEHADISYYFENIKEQMSMLKNLKLVIQIFLYGFIVLISLIGISNIFNTITTNINLRRREFANLKSVGMTDKSFSKMLNLECVFYGTKALLYGLPLGVLMCYLLSKAFGNVVTFIFELPYSSILISIVAVYLIVFVTMIYASRKVKKENIIDVIRNDNI